MSGTEPVLPASPRRGPSRLVLVATVVSLLAGLVVVGATLLAGPLLRDRITEEARKRGVEIAFNSVSYWGRTVSLGGVAFRLIGVPGVGGTLEHLDVGLSGWDPTRLHADGVRVAVVGGAAELAMSLAEWTRQHPAAFALPVSAKRVDVTWRPTPNEAPWLTIEGGEMTEAKAGVTFRATRAVASGVDVGSVAATWTHEAASITMGFGSDDPTAAPVTATVRHAAQPPTATITLAPTELARLAGPLGVPLLAPGAVASGRADLTFARGLEAGPIDGRVEARLDGWVPPHPVELDGFLFGGTTTFTTALAIPTDRRTIDLTGSRVRAGAFELSGGGRIERHEDFATVKMTLRGNLPCAAIAASAATARMGSFLGALVGGAAQRVVDGSVSVRVSLSADTRRLDAAEVQPTIGVGCGLAPARALDPRALQQLPDRMQELVRKLPPLPSLPDFTLRAPDQR